MPGVKSQTTLLFINLVYSPTPTVIMCPQSRLNGKMRISSEVNTCPAKYRSVISIRRPAPPRWSLVACSCSFGASAVNSLLRHVLSSQSGSSWSDVTFCPPIATLTWCLPALAEWKIATAVKSCTTTHLVQECGSVQGNGNLSLDRPQSLGDFWDVRNEGTIHT